jgi:hypothetical protein
LSHGSLVGTTLLAIECSMIGGHAHEYDMDGGKSLAWPMLRLVKLALPGCKVRWSPAAPSQALELKTLSRS